MSGPGRNARIDVARHVVRSIGYHREHVLPRGAPFGRVFRALDAAADTAVGALHPAVDVYFEKRLVHNVGQVVAALRNTQRERCKGFRSELRQFQQLAGRPLQVADLAVPVSGIHHAAPGPGNDPFRLPVYQRVEIVCLRPLGIVTVAAAQVGSRGVVDSRPVVRMVIPGADKVGIRRQHLHAAALVIKSLHGHIKGLVPGPRPDNEGIAATDPVHGNPVGSGAPELRKIHYKQVALRVVGSHADILFPYRRPSHPGFTRKHGIVADVVDEPEGQPLRITDPAARSRPTGEVSLLERVVAPKSGLVHMNRLAPAQHRVEDEMESSGLQIDSFGTDQIAVPRGHRLGKPEVDEVSCRMEHAPEPLLLGPVGRFRLAVYRNGGDAPAERGIAGRADRIALRATDEGCVQRDADQPFVYRQDVAVLPDEVPQRESVADHPYGVVLAQPGLPIDGQRIGRMGRIPNLPDGKDLSLHDLQTDQVGCDGRNTIHTGQRLAGPGLRDGSPDLAVAPPDILRRQSEDDTCRQKEGYRKFGSHESVPFVTNLFDRDSAVTRYSAV